MRQTAWDDDGKLYLHAGHYKQGPYFKSPEDYDYGWVYRTPEMEFNQMRRSRLEVATARAAFAAGVAAMFLPIITWGFWAFAESLWYLIPAVLWVGTCVWFVRQVGNPKFVFAALWKGRLPDMS